MLTYYRTAKRPDIRLWWQDDDGNLINFSGAAFQFKIGFLGQTAVFTKTTGITGAAGSGTEPTGTPNVTIGFTTGELDTIPVDRYRWQLRETTTGRIYQGDIEIIDVIL